MTSAISTFLESLAPASAGVGLLLSGSSEAEGNTPPTAPTPPTPPDSEMGATAGGRSASYATSAKRSSEPPRAPPADARVYCLEGRGAGGGALATYIRTFRAVAKRSALGAARPQPHSARSAPPPAMLVHDVCMRTRDALYRHATVRTGPTLESICNGTDAICHI